MTDQTQHDDLNFMDELEAAARLSAPASANYLLWTITALIAFIFIWAAFADVETMTRGQGQVVPSSDTQLVQSLEGGILQELSVQEGDRVEKGQILGRIDNTGFASEERGIEAQSLGLELTMIRLKAEIDNTAFTIPDDLKNKNKKLSANENDLYEARQAELKNALSIADETVRKAQANLAEVKATINRLTESKRLIEEQMAITRGLVAKKAMPRMEMIKQEREYNDVIGNLSATRERKKAVEAELEGARRQKDDIFARFKSQALQALSEAETRASAIKESLTAAGDRVDRTALRAPSDGIIKTITQKTIGGIIEPAMVVMEIVPIDDDLKITAKVNPADIAFLKVGQPVNVKISAYDSTRYGALKGKLTRISADATEDRDGNIFFEIDVVTQRNYLGTKDAPLPIIPGMIAETEVITGSRTILSYMMKPLLRARDVALTEQ